MSHRKAVLLLFNILVFVSLIGCAVVPTTSRVKVSSDTIAYFVKHGQGPAVVFQSGLGDGKSVWESVVDKMPESVTLFAYDRPGYGDSPTSTDPRDPCSVARELHALLRVSGIMPPYVLVGHSLGGSYQFHFAKLFPEEVAGLVLLDPTHPKHWSRMNEDATLQAGIVRGLRLIAFSEAMRREFDDQEDCRGNVDILNRLNVPVWLLFSGQFKLEERGPYERMVRELRSQWMHLFVNAHSLEISESGHYIQKEASGAVVIAILNSIDAWKVSRNAVVR